MNRAAESKTGANASRLQVRSFVDKLFLFPPGASITHGPFFRGTAERPSCVERGLVRIFGPSVFRGYWPDVKAEPTLPTEDLGRIDAHGRLHILGRRDAVIITGGEKVFPLEVETVLRTSGEFDDLAVIGLPDPQWGQIVVACHPPCTKKMDTEKIDAALERLVAYKRPKRFLEIFPWPRNAQGKLSRKALLAAASARLNPGEQSRR